MSFPRYPSYKDSGVEWLGEVPGHWKIDRLKRSTVSAKNGIWGDEAQQNEYDIPCVRVADFDRQGLRVELIEPTIRNVATSERVGRVLNKGDLLLEKSGGGEGQPVGCVVLYDDHRPAVCSNFVARVETAPGMDSSYWRYVHAAAYAVRLNTRSIKQTSGIQNLDASQYLDERAGFPPLPEQTQIAAFLDRETAKIDTLVAEQRRLMDLLKEKRQAVISDAVTRGLNPDAPMKPSGIEWLGDVPEHWDCGGLTKFIGPIVDYRGRTPIKQDDGVFLVTARNIKNGKIDYEASEEYVDPDSAESLLERGRPEVGDLLFTMEAPLGQVALIDRTDIALAQRIVKFRGKPNVMSSSFLLLWLMSEYCQARLLTLATGSTALGIKSSKLGMIDCLVPPMSEQLEISAFIDSETVKMDRLVCEAQRAIDLLQERRTALISAAVTGQIDVREVMHAGTQRVAA
jgi:type I restriction enzyme S subunit